MSAVSSSSPMLKELTLPPGVTTTDTTVAFNIQGGRYPNYVQHKQKLNVQKSETTELTYKLAIQCLETSGGGKTLGIKINDRQITNQSHGGSAYYFSGSTFMSFTPVGPDCIKMHEKDNRGAEKTNYITISPNECSISSKPKDAGFAQKIERAKKFEHPNTNLELKAVLHNEEHGIILCFKSQGGYADEGCEFYYAKDGEKFQKCWNNQYATNYSFPHHGGNFQWKIKLPGESQERILSFFTVEENGPGCTRYNPGLDTENTSKGIGFTNLVISK